MGSGIPGATGDGLGLTVKGQTNDHYLQLVQRFGDSTNPAAQVQALASMGIRAQFRTNGDGKALIQQLTKGIPCPVGWLHHGSAAAPSGGGHWSLVVGSDPNTQQFLMHDPPRRGQSGVRQFCARCNR